MDWCGRNGVRYVFGLPVDAALDPKIFAKTTRGNSACKFS